MIKLESVRFAYKRDTIFQDIDLTFEAGNIYGLFGLNGAGKSTLLRLLVGLLFPQEGKIHVLGQNISKRLPALTSQIYLLPETPWLPAVSEKQFLSRMAPFYSNFDAVYMDRLLEELELPRGQQLTSFSLGERKKFHLAFGLACKPAILVLDEPTNGMDIPSKGFLRKMIVEALTDERMLILATHHVKDLEMLIDKVLILHNGKFICNQSITEISNNFRFSIESTNPDLGSDKLLYTEPCVGGYATVWADSNSEDNQPDLELLFKAAVANPIRFS